MFKSTRKSSDMVVIPDLDMLNTIPFSKMALSELMISGNQETGISLVSDVDVLLTQQEFLSRHPEYADEFLKQAAQSAGSPDAYADLRKDLTDEQIAMFIKSRRIQTPSEMRIWVDHLADVATEIKSSISDVVKQEYQKFVDEQQSTVEDPAPITPAAPKS